MNDTLVRLVAVDVLICILVLAFYVIQIRHLSKLREVTAETRWITWSLWATHLYHLAFAIGLLAYLARRQYVMAQAGHVETPRIVDYLVSAPGADIGAVGLMLVSSVSPVVVSLFARRREEERATLLAEKRRLAVELEAERRSRVGGAG